MSSMTNRMTSPSLLPYGDPVRRVDRHSEGEQPPGSIVATDDPELIRRWALRHRAEPATGEATASGPAMVDVHDGDAGIRFNFPAAAKFRSITWDVCLRAGHAGNDSEWPVSTGAQAQALENDTSIGSTLTSTTYAPQACCAPYPAETGRVSSSGTGIGRGLRREVIGSALALSLCRGCVSAAWPPACVPDHCRRPSPDASPAGDQDADFRAALAVHLPTTGYEFRLHMKGARR